MSDKFNREIDVIFLLEKLETHFNKNWIWYFFIFEILIYSVTKKTNSLVFGVLIFPFIYLSVKLSFLFLETLFNSENLIQKLLLCLFCLGCIVTLYPFIEIFFDIVNKFIGIQT